MGDTAHVNVANSIQGHEADRIALISGNREISYGELVDSIARLRGGLAAAGVGDGDRVAMLCGNTYYFVLAYYAVVGLGAIAVPLNPASPAPEIERQFSVVEPTAVIVGHTGAKTWSQISPEVADTMRLIAHADGEATDGLTNEVGGAERSERTRSLDELMQSEPHPVVDVDPDHLATLLFSSGTAGPPNAAMLTHGNLIANVAQVLDGPDHTSSADVVYGVLPAFHIFGLNVMIGTTFTVGATLVLVQRFDPLTAVESIARRGVTVMPGAPPMWHAFVQFDDLPDTSFQTIRMASSGASRLSPKVSAAFFERFGIQLREGYGLTEASPVVSNSNGIEPRVGSVGKVLAGQQVRLVDGDGNDVPTGDAGEIWVKGDNVFAGYWNDPEATARVLVDGWLRTGDVGTVDDDGYLYLVDRAKDLIIVSGFNVFPAEVEEVISRHPGVLECAVVGVPHPHTGEAVRAFVVVDSAATTTPSPGTAPTATTPIVTEEGIIEYTAEYLARYKCPTKVMFLDALPRNAGGKVVRRELDSTILSET